MRYRPSVLAALALALVLALAAPAAAAPTLERGDRGPAVRSLQRLLGIRADGVFGPGTARAVRGFQRRHRMRVDGVVGPATWRILRRSRHRGGRGNRRLRAMVRAANRIAGRGYRWGGGHGRWNDSGYDCSGAVSYVLHAAGLLRESRTADRFMRWGVRGRGRRVTVYANGGHVFMVIDGRRFDSTGEAGSFWRPRMRDTSNFVARHPAGL
jgi:hypothetical protein